MRRRGAALPVISAFLRDLHAPEPHGEQLQRGRISADLRPGCSVSPPVFRLVVEGCVEDARREWSRQGQGFRLAGFPLLQLERSLVEGQRAGSQQTFDDAG